MPALSGISLGYRAAIPDVKSERNCDTRGVDRSENWFRRVASLHARREASSGQAWLVLEERALVHVGGYSVGDPAGLIGDVVAAGLDVDDNIGHRAQHTLARVAVAALLGIRLGNRRGVPGEVSDGP